MREIYRGIRRDTRHSISADRIALLEKEAAELSDTFKQDRFKGYRLLKRQHRTSTKAVMPPEKEFTEQYRTQYQLGTEVPLEVSSCALPASPSMTIYRVTNLIPEFVVSIRTVNPAKTAAYQST